MAKIVVVIPTYNEKENTQKMIDVLAKEFSLIKDHEMELLYVDGNSPDGTSGVVKTKMKMYPWLHLLVEVKKEGLGKAYAKAFKYAMDKLRADYVMEFDSDFQHRPDEIKRLVAKVNDGYDYVIGSRYIKGGSIPKEWSFVRKFLSIVGNLVARIGLLIPQYHDLTTGFKLTRVRGFMDRVPLDNLYSNSFAYKIHILADVINRGAKTVEVPITFMSRTSGESKLIKNEMIESLKVIFLFQIHNPKILRFLKFGTVGFAGYLITAIGTEVFSGSGLAKSLADLFMNMKGTVLEFVAEPSAWAVAIATELAIISNFTFNNIWTFSEAKISSLELLVRKFFEFNLTSVGAIVIQFVIIGIGVVFFDDTRVTRQIFLLISMPVVLSFNYAMYNIFIWRTWRFSFAK